ncbi:hypothetical protein AMTR_s00137p00084070 [Amborella trichopoda]|uniref:Uncharacterized protein n=1 Tax=Amborella trichopoda TaxID=13333 RepID=W1NFH7_AMBTC|nr:hypothetical protein AMTR_s00137p00084070 [Amborella trichopoda]
MLWDVFCGTFWDQLGDAHLGKGALDGMKHVLQKVRTWWRLFFVLLVRSIWKEREILKLNGTMLSADVQMLAAQEDGRHHRPALGLFGPVWYGGLGRVLRHPWPFW